MRNPKPLHAAHQDIDSGGDLVALIRRADDTSKNGTTNGTGQECGENMALSREVDPRFEIADRRTVEQERDYHFRVWRHEVTFDDDHGDTAVFGDVEAS
jgi:hypothetical protein